MAGFKNNRQLTLRQERVLRALVVYPTVRAAAQAAHIPERTVYRWMSQRDFRARLEEVEEDPLGASRERCHYLAGDALAVLHEIMRDGGVDAASRVQAAAAFLRHASPVAGAGRDAP